MNGPAAGPPGEVAGQSVGGAAAGPTGGPGLAASVVARLTQDRQTLAVAESLTGGLLSARVVDVPGASAVFRGAVVAYATDLKARLLGVDRDLLALRGAVDAEVATQLAAGARAQLGSDWALATTGVAGPDPQDGQPPGTVFVGVSGPVGSRVRQLRLAGDRSRIRSDTVTEALRLLLFAMGEQGT